MNEARDADAKALDSEEEQELQEAGAIGVSQNQGYHFGCPNNKDYSIFGSVLGSHYFGNFRFCSGRILFGVLKVWGEGRRMFAWSQHRFWDSGLRSRV